MLVSHFAAFCRYPLDRALNKENIDVPYNDDLSEIDKAFIMLTYPGREDTSLDMTLEKAMEIAAIPANAAKEIQALVTAGQNIHALGAYAVFMIYKQAVATRLCQYIHSASLQDHHHWD